MCRLAGNILAPETVNKVQKVNEKERHFHKRYCRDQGDVDMLIKTEVKASSFSFCLGKHFG